MPDRMHPILQGSRPPCKSFELEMVMALRLISVFICCCLMPALLWADPLVAVFIFIQHLDKKNDKHGRVHQAFKLVCTDKKVEAIAVFYRENRGPTLYQTKVADACFTISADRPSGIQVFAIARTAHKTLLAHTETMLFGQSKTLPERVAVDPTATAGLSILPYIDLVSPDNYYWNQTGQTFRFRIKAPFDAGQTNLSVLENGRTHSLSPNRGSEFVYVPPHDPNLRKAGVQAFRNDILFACVMEGGAEFKLTYSLMVHRSRYALNNHPAGIAVFTVSVFFFAGLIMIKRKTPWWKKFD